MGRWRCRGWQQSSTGHSRTWLSDRGWWCRRHGGSRTPPPRHGAAPRRKDGWSRSPALGTGAPPRPSSPRTPPDAPWAPRSGDLLPCSPGACNGGDDPSRRFSSWSCSYRRSQMDSFSLGGALLRMVLSSAIALCDWLLVLVGKLLY